MVKSNGYRTHMRKCSSVWYLLYPLNPPAISPPLPPSTSYTGHKSQAHIPTYHNSQKSAIKYSLSQFAGKSARPRDKPFIFADFRSECEFWEMMLCNNNLSSGLLLHQRCGFFRGLGISLETDAPL